MLAFGKGIKTDLKPSLNEISQVIIHSDNP